MRNIIIAALLAAGLVFIPNQANARERAENTGNEWLEYCGDGGTHGKEMWCLGYTQALDHTASMLSLMVNKQYFCPNGVYTIGQTQAIMKRYLYRNPAKRSDVMMSVYIDAMQEAFPCR